ncbi:MAG: hypothetical protein FGM57_02630 [Candidatus Taylorbacteria bacterium]|nr:hypothetical protein [Candidatus Taylorbacteria bacterium]
MHDIVVFGITGDLAKKKLIPSLSRVASFKKIRVIGFGRKKLKQSEFASFLEEEARNSGHTFKNALEGFEAVYIHSELNDPMGFSKLQKKLRKEATIYMALPPSMQLAVSKQLVNAGVVTSKNQVRIAFEKPFGSNTTEAAELNTYLHKHMREDQILRVDHYAGKETLLDLESSGRIGIFSYVASYGKIKELTIRFEEKISADMRGSFYDSVGALSDVAQNHMIHMLTTFIAAHAESCIYTSKENTCLISTSATSSLKQIRSLIASSLEVVGKPVLGQYIGFKNISGVSPSSKTETYAQFSVRLKKKDVKVMGSEINESMKHIYKIFGNTKISFSLGKNMPTNDVSIETVSSHSYKLMINRNCGTDAYDEIFTALIEKNFNRFVSFEQIQAGWRIVEEVKRRAKGKIVEYSVGTKPRA